MVRWLFGRTNYVVAARQKRLPRYYLSCRSDGIVLNVSRLLIVKVFQKRVLHAL